MSPSTEAVADGGSEQAAAPCARALAPLRVAIVIGVAGVVGLSGCVTRAASGGDVALSEAAAAPVTSGAASATPNPTVTNPAHTVPGTCPDPNLWTTRALAELVVVPGIDGGGGWPEWLPATTGGVFLDSLSTGLAAGNFTAPPVSSTISPFVAVDFEGGVVSRHADVIGALPSPRDQSATMSPAEIQSVAAERGQAMRQVGITVDFAPVVDLDLGSPIVGSRSYGSESDVVVRNAGAFATGLQQAHVVPTLKHFPGHGSTEGDSHEALASTESWDVLARRDVVVFQELLARPGPWLVMMGHVVVPGLSADAETPASVDPATYRALRDTTGYTGPVITDDLASMRAISDRLPPDQAVVSAISAGADLALLSEASTLDDAVTALTTWADVDVAHRTQLVASATRAMSVMPCGTGW